MVLPIPVPMAVATYFTMWWTLLFAILPIGVRSQREQDDVVPGSEPGAPHKANMLRKVGWTTALTTATFLIFIAVLSYFPDS